MLYISQKALNCDEVSLFLVVFKRINRLIRNLYSEFFGKFILKHHEEQMQVKSFQCVQKLIETSYFHQMNKRRHCRISHQCAGGSRRRKWGYDIPNIGLVVFLSPLGTNKCRSSIGIKYGKLISRYYSDDAHDSDLSLLIVTPTRCSNSKIILIMILLY